MNSIRSEVERPHEVVIVNAGRTVHVPDNANLREMCLREKLPLYFGLGRIFNCAGRARCGTCLVRVLDGFESLTPPTPFERRRKGDGDLSLRLACQANVRGSVKIDTRGSSSPRQGSACDAPPTTR